MKASEFVDLVLTKDFKDIEEMKRFYDKACSEFDEMNYKDKETVKFSMCLEMLDRAIKYNAN